MRPRSHIFQRGVVMLVALLLVGSLRAAEAPALRVKLLSASAEYESDKSLAGLQKLLEDKYRIVCSRSFGRDKGNELPGLEDLEGTDLVIVFTRRVNLPPAQLAALKKYLAAGRPMIGVRTASHAFENYKEFDREVWGGSYKGHFTNSEAKIYPAPGRADHPVLAGVGSFTSRKLYKNPALLDEVTVLLEGETATVREPVAWVRNNHGGRVFYTSLGVQSDFEDENFRRLLVNAVFWVTDRSAAQYQKSKP